MLVIGTFWTLLSLHVLLTALSLDFLEFHSHLLIVLLDVVVIPKRCVFVFRLLLLHNTILCLVFFPRARHIFSLGFGGALALGRSFGLRCGIGCGRTVGRSFSFLWGLGGLGSCGRAAGAGVVGVVIDGLFLCLIVDVNARFLGAARRNCDLVPFDRPIGGDERYEKGVLCALFSGYNSGNTLWSSYLLGVGPLGSHFGVLQTSIKGHLNLRNTSLLSDVVCLLRML